MKNNYSTTIFWVLVIALALVGYMMYSVENITRASFIKHEGIVLELSEDAPDIPQIDIEIINQNDNRWGMNYMFDDLKMRFFEYGSQITCTSAIFRRFGIIRDPYELYTMFLDAELYSPDGSDPFSDAKNEYLFYKYKLSFDSPKLNTESVFTTDTVLEHLNNGIPLMVRTEHPLIERYWVVITGVENGEFIIMDPTLTEYGKLSTYGNKIYEIVYFTTEEPDIQE